MEKKKNIDLKLIFAVVLFLLFVVLTVLVLTVDVKQIGPMGTEVGLSGINGAVRDAIGSNEWLYKLTGLAGYIPLAVVMGFVVFGLLQLIKRRSFKSVDSDIYFLACLYAMFMVFYVVFEIFIVCYRPILLEEYPEASYPSSHSMFATGIMFSASLQFWKRIKIKWLKLTASVLSALVGLFIVIGRFFSGVHWLTDIIGGILLGTALVLFYAFFADRFSKRSE